MAGTGPLHSENITGLLDDLDKALHEVGERAEFYLAGGARMLFGWRTDRHTKDLDGVMRSGQTVLMTTAMRMSERHGLEPTWLNPAVTYFVPTKPDPDETTLYSGKALTVKGASIEHMLAMKIRSHRDIDLDDAEVLIGRLKLTSTREIQRIADDAYEGHSGDNGTRIREGLKRIAETMPELSVNHLASEHPRPLRAAAVHQDNRDRNAKNAPTPKRPSTRTPGPGGASAKSRSGATAAPEGKNRTATKRKAPQAGGDPAVGAPPARPQTVRRKGPDRRRTPKPGDGGYEH